jgi:hypothetical protein
MSDGQVDLDNNRDPVFIIYGNQLFKTYLIKWEIGSPMYGEVIFNLSLRSIEE